MIQPIFVEPRPGYRIWVQYSDGVADEVDLSGLVGRGVFQAWRTPGYFEKVHVASHRAIAWYDDVELCSDALYLELTGKSIEEVMPGAKFLAQNT
jgi:hypothetical protein